MLAQERADRQEAEAALAVAQLGMDVAKRMEIYYRHLTEYAIDLITILEVDGTIRFESRSVTRDLGWEPEEYRGKNAFEFVHPDDMQMVAEAFGIALQNHGSTPVLSFRFRCKDGSYRVLEGRGNNLSDDPAVGGIVFNSRDVTERRRLEENFHQAQKVQAIGQLTGGVAHDFNNILTVIIGYSDLALRQMPAQSTAHGSVEEIRRAADRAAALTRQLLAFSRRQVLQPRVMNLVTVISDMEKMLRRLLGEHIELVLVAPQGVGNVKADVGQIEQVILNLVVNARDALPSGGRLTLETGNVRLDDRYAAIQDGVHPGDYVMLAVSDNGTGIAPEVMEHIFEPFFTTKADGHGTGLGLATCHGIIKQSGGHIIVYSEVRRGTIFKIFLPMVEDPVEEFAPAVAEPSPAGGREVILVVEDEPMLRDLGTTILEELGYKVFTAGNGREAMELMSGGGIPHIDLVLTDLIMPEMGGQELVKHLLPLFPTTKVIYTSGYTEDSIIWSGGLEPDVHFLPKPYSVLGIAAKVREVLTLEETAAIR